MKDDGLAGKRSRIESESESLSSSVRLRLLTRQSKGKREEGDNHIPASAWARFLLPLFCRCTDSDVWQMEEGEGEGKGWLSLGYCCHCRPNKHLALMANLV